jgi:hypothetical protein
MSRLLGKIMATVESLLLHGFSSSTTPAKELFSTTSKQVMVRDDVVFAPSMDPYLPLAEANKRLKAGLSLFVENNISENEPETAEQ